VDESATGSVNFFLRGGTPWLEPAGTPGSGCRPHRAPRIAPADNGGPRHRRSV